MNTEHDDAKALIKLLDESTDHLDAHVLSRLAAARRQAVEHLQSASMAVAGPASLTAYFVDILHNHRAVMSTALLCGTVIIVFFVSQQFLGPELLDQGDAFLLASDLPPEAYLDKGFDEWLELTSQH